MIVYHDKLVVKPENMVQWQQQSEVDDEEAELYQAVLFMVVRHGQ